MERLVCTLKLFKRSLVLGSKMQMKFSVDIRTSKTAAEVQQTISAATERETVPFVFDFEGPPQKPTPFVSKVTENKVRIWKTPPRFKASSRCYPYFCGEVRDLIGERHLVVRLRCTNFISSPRLFGSLLEV